MATKAQRAARYAALPAAQKAAAVRTIASLIRTQGGWIEDYAATFVAARLLAEGSNPTPAACRRIRADLTSL